VQHQSAAAAADLLDVVVCVHDGFVVWPAPLGGHGSGSLQVSAATKY
jgi:hypothetical protein